MGGKAFAGKTRRFERSEYFDLIGEVSRMMVPFSAALVVIPAYNEKPSFGDMDILFTPSVEISKQLLMTTFGCAEDEVLHNGGVWSLVYKGFQLDLITTRWEEMDYALNYFSFNDRGNLVGRLAHKLGLKHGHDGLWFPVRSKDHTLGEVLLTLDPREAEEFLDVVAPPADGFDTLEEIFENVAASKYFNPDIFLLENRNHTSRVRDRKRATYTAFLEWCKTQSVKSEYYQFDADKTMYHRKIFKAFPHARAEFDELWRRKFEIEAAALKFNGDLVKEWTGRENAQLGELMKVLKVDLVPTVVNMMTEDAIHKVVMEQHNKLKEVENA
jgi:hypothetical protein